MFTKAGLAEWRQPGFVFVCLFALLLNNLTAYGANGNHGNAHDNHVHDNAKGKSKGTERIRTATPIKHVIVLIGENRTFDHLFATYVPRKGEHVKNLLSEGIINADGSLGPNAAIAQQNQATAPFQTEYFISLSLDQKTPYDVLPSPTLNFSPTGPTPPPSGTGPYATTPTSAVEPSLEPQDLPLLTTGAATEFAQSSELPDFDSRVANFNTLPNGPFPLRGALLPYDSYTGDTTHRLFEMWQQSDCSVSNATVEVSTAQFVGVPGSPSIFTHLRSRLLLFQLVNAFFERVT